jgi:hypothetical protein
MGYHHPSGMLASLLSWPANNVYLILGEKRILSPGSWVACTGQENMDNLCTNGAVPNILEGDVNDHGKYIHSSIGCSALNGIASDGPYEDVTLGSCP